MNRTIRFKRLHSFLGFAVIEEIHIYSVSVVNEGVLG